MANKDGFDSNKRWGNSAQKGHGANSPAMMEARKSFAKKKELAGKISKGDKYGISPKDGGNRQHKELVAQQKRISEKYNK